MSVVERMVQTSHAEIAVAETSGKGFPVVLIHGNSSCKEVFRNQLAGPLGETNRVVAIDLPGHGRSSNAFDPARTYSMPGYASAMMEALAGLGIDKAVVVGWSLGGHVGLEMMPLFEGMAGLMIMGTPPVSHGVEAIQKGFQPTPSLLLAGKKDFTPEDVQAFAAITCGAMADAGLRRAIERTDGLARSMNFESLLAGKASDQRQLAENSRVPLAIVNGSEDPIVNVDYIGSLSYQNLWEGQCFVLKGLGHVPFLEAPKVFNPILGRFVTDMEKQVAMPASGRRRNVAAA
ncbi:MAG: alpha/beta hydrolase [Rhizobiales bacterium]|nr:alpha/beta hydrolase [Hyphomicrobiales bacterium]MBN9010513.1 alpha/beta hydrolase [Hyphomicrobiales bacterium]